ncbi:methyltransferase family protein [Azohydromonas caseinilytica]|uniref:Isoprenylcysteine carboxylmethyltransferase family protein n=1 Tax=Azohydromonas caseinilytica TaxID=2728836 RepID=A0A848F354_9BURK|nr:isoprenylcysteine carboxylmethyltransferase family protein [Azohydromonas caseinilytica]NML13832.1 isoprenylcysteine carboxylmethyltransferase family protein [Azohydromonas caseinilytica]
MLAFYRAAFPVMWMAGLCSVWFLALGGKPVERRESWGSWLLHMGPIALAMLLLALPRLPVLEVLNRRLYPWASWEFWVPAAVTAAGLVFTVWSRAHIGRNASVAVTLKRGHELVTTGPYAITRHPMYTGLLTAFLASAVSLGQWRGFLGFLIFWAALWRKWRLEERWMRERFGEAYEAYSRRVPGVVPFWR